MFRKKKDVHLCRLTVEDEDVDAGLPKSDPSSGACRRWIRQLRKVILVSFDNTQTHFYIRSKPALIAERRRQCRSRNWFVIHPLSVFALYWHIIMTVVWIACGFIEPFFAAFVTTHIAIWSGFQLVFIVDVIVNFIHGHIHDKTQEIILDIRLIIRRYILGHFITDMLSVLTVPICLTVLDSWVEDKNDNLATCCHLALLQTLCRVLRLLVAAASVSSAVRYMGLGHLFTTILGIVFKTFFILHYGACINFAISYHLTRTTDEDATFVRVTDLYYDPSIGKRYVRSLLQVCCLFFRSSEGVLGINTMEERIFQSALLVAGLFYFAYSTVLVYDIVEVHTAVGNRFEDLLMQLREYMVQRKLPLHLRKRVINYYNHRFERKYFRESLILDTLSEHLRFEIVLFTCMPLVKKAPFLSRLPRSLIGQLMAAFNREVFLHNDVVFKAGDVPHKMYFIYAGTVAMYSPEGVEYFHFEDGDNFGELCIIMGGTRRCSAVAVETTEVFSLTSHDLRRCLRTYPQFWSGMKATVEKRFNQAISELDRMAKAGKKIVTNEIKDTYEYL